MSTPTHRTASGSSYFVTTKCLQGRQIFQVTEVAETLIKTLFDYRDRGEYLLHEFVVMPDHIHVLLTPGPKISLEKAVQFMKGGSSHRIHKERAHKMEIWQAGFYDWTIRDAEDWRIESQYIRMNPVRAKLVDRSEEWPYSSASGKHELDAMPEKYLRLASGAEAQITSPTTPELKLRPPKEEGV